MPEAPEVTTARCYHPCACGPDVCTHHGRRCTNPPLPGGLCAEHGCVKCGHVILANYEDERLCHDCGLLQERVGG